MKQKAHIVIQFYGNQTQDIHLNEDADVIYEALTHSLDDVELEVGEKPILRKNIKCITIC